MIHESILNINYSVMVTFGHFYAGSILYYIILYYIILYYMLYILELDGSRRTRRFLQNSTVLAELDSSCRTRRFLQNSTVRRTRRFAQNSTVRAELDSSCRTQRFAELDGSCRRKDTSMEVLQNKRSCVEKKRGFRVRYS